MQDVTRGIDTSLTLKLQKRLTELEQEKQSLRNELENKEEQFQRARARVLTCSHTEDFIDRLLSRIVPNDKLFILFILLMDV